MLHLHALHVRLEAAALLHPVHVVLVHLVDLVLHHLVLCVEHVIHLLHLFQELSGRDNLSTILKVKCSDITFSEIIY